MNRTVRALAVLALLGGVTACGGSTSDAPAATTSTADTPVTPAERSVEPAEAAEMSGEAATIVRVVDGDTFEISGGRTVRVLGIESCESDTDGGREATETAERWISGAQVTLSQEPGVDRDLHGRLLRYVDISGVDFGEYMVRYDHTGVYEGGGDASAEYMQALYASDTMYSRNPPSGRECGDPDPEPEPAPEPELEPEPEPVEVEPASDCHPSYEPCIPNGPDLDCGDLDHAVRVSGSDEYRLDRDDDGVGCE